MWANGDIQYFGQSSKESLVNDFELDPGVLKNCDTKERIQLRKTGAGVVEFRCPIIFDSSIPLWPFYKTITTDSVPGLER